MAYIIESSARVSVPAEFARDFMLDINNWAKINHTDGYEGTFQWEGTPWRIGSTIVGRSTSPEGKVFTARQQVVQAMNDELYRVAGRILGFRGTVACAIQEHGIAESTIMYVIRAEGWITLFARFVSTEGMAKHQEETIRSEVELAWHRAREA